MVFIFEEKNDFIQKKMPFFLERCIFALIWSLLKVLVPNAIYSHLNDQVQMQNFDLETDFSKPSHKSGESVNLEEFEIIWKDFQHLSSLSFSFLSSINFTLTRGLFCIIK